MDEMKSEQQTEDLPKEQNLGALPPSASQEERMMVVGIGASAGGLNALQTFFDALPADTGMVFVVVTHLHPERESLLGELLQRHTSMPVHQVIEPVAIAPNNVYVLTPNRSIILTDSHLETTEFGEPRGQRAPIDYFFRSLANVHRDVVAVILSGGGTDGSVGVKAIKEQGGLLLIQDPEEAEFDSMPRAAIATGLADVVLPVRQLAEKLVGYDRQKIALPQDPDALTTVDVENVHRILTQVHSRTGHDFRQYKRSTILRRIQRRMQLNGYMTLEAYLGYLRHNVTEAHTLFNDLLIGVTNFFRDPDAWNFLAQQIVPHLFERKSVNDTVRVWTIGCSTGEEAYSLAIVLMEAAEKQETRPQIQVFASDLDESALTRAREGIYPQAIEADVSVERLKRFFIKEGNYYRIHRELRDIVLFSDHSVLRDPPFSRLDLISCRNLLIYLQREMQESVFEIFHYALNVDGYLFLGGAESAEMAHELFRTINKTYRIYQSRPWRGGTPAVPMLPLVANRPIPPQTSRSWLRSGYRNLDVIQTSGSLHRDGLEDYGPPSILVDEAYHILHLSETAGRYLLHPKGPMTTDLLKLVRPELQFELRTALFEAFSKNKAIVTAPVYVQFNGHPRRVILSVRPRLPDKNSSGLEEQLALVIFLENELDENISLAGRHVPEAMKDDPEQKLSDTIVEQLESEVQHLREQLQAHIEEYESSTEELKAANEELQSINEEYRSTTEELETSKEELQSVNEELQTVNNELKTKLEEISRAHSDLENLMAAPEIATLFLDRDLRIKRFTPGVEVLFNIMASDRGRPIAHLTNKLFYEQLTTDAANVLRQLIPVERELHGHDDQWFLARLRPYRTIDDRIDGVVITFVDISKLKQNELDLREQERALQNAKDYSDKIIDTVREGLLVLESDLTIQFANQSFYSFFGLTPQGTIGTKIYNLNQGEWDIPALRQLLEEVLPQNDVFNDFEMTHEFHNMGVRTLRLNGRRVNHVQLILLAIEDITERRQTMQSLQEREQELRQLNQTLEKKVEERTKILHELASQMTRAEQQERQRISEILHDELQQRLYTVQIQLKFLRDTLGDKGDATTLAELTQMEEGLRDVIESTRNLSIDLSPPILRDEGLRQALDWLATQMQTQYGLHVDVQTEADDETFALVDKNLHVLLFQMVRELLFNVVKHAQVNQAQVTLAHVDSAIHITVSDDGQGFNPEATSRSQSQGLRNIRYRMNLVEGDLQIESQPGTGTRITLTAPLVKAPRSS